MGFQLSGLYLYGSGDRIATRWGVDLRGIGTNQAGEHRLRPDGTIVPRNSFVTKPVHRVDMRLQRKFPLVGRANIDGILELFNVFNRANFERYSINESAANYGQPLQAQSIAFGPRVLQLGFRFAF